MASPSAAHAPTWLPGLLVLCHAPCAELSPASQCPQCEMLSAEAEGTDPGYAWNPTGTDISRGLYRFPVVLLSNKTTWEMTRVRRPMHPLPCGCFMECCACFRPLLVSRFCPLLVSRFCPSPLLLRSSAPGPLPSICATCTALCSLRLPCASPLCAGAAGAAQRGTWVCIPALRGGVRNGHAGEASSMPTAGQESEQCLEGPAGSVAHCHLSAVWQEET